MASKFGWIDFSEKERRQMLDVVQLFSERETRDELGVGTMRDAFAEYFFPGTSTIQTRAKYMLLISPRCNAGELCGNGHGAAVVGSVLKKFGDKVFIAGHKTGTQAR